MRGVVLPDFSRPVPTGCGPSCRPGTDRRISALRPRRRPAVNIGATTEKASAGGIYTGGLPLAITAAFEAPRRTSEQARRNPLLLAEGKRGLHRWEARRLHAHGNTAGSGAPVSARTHCRRTEL